MEIKKISEKAVLLKGKKESVLINPSDEILKSDKNSRIIAFNSADDMVSNMLGDKVIISGPGEYEIGGVEVMGINGGNGQTVYVFNIDGLSVCIVGDLAEPLSDKKIERIDNVDVLIATAADRKEVGNKTILGWAKKWGVNYLIPVDYSDNELKKFLDDTDMEGLEPVDSLKVEKDNLPDGMEITVLKKI